MDVLEEKNHFKTSYRCSPNTLIFLNLEVCDSLYYCVVVANSWSRSILQDCVQWNELWGSGWVVLSDPVAVGCWLLMASPALWLHVHASCLHFPSFSWITVLLYVMLLHLLDMFFSEYVLEYEKMDVFTCLCLLQDWRQTLVSGLAAFLWIWHQHSQLHRFGKYLFSVSLRVTVYILWWSVDSPLTHRNKCFLLPRTLLQSNKPAALPQPWCTPSFFLPSDALRCTSTSWSVSPQFPPFLPRDTSTVPLVWSLSSSSAFCRSFISLLDTPVCSFSVPAGCRMSLSMLQRQRAELTSCVSS